MALSPLALKVLGVGAIATVGTGGIILHKNGFFEKQINYQELDKFALKKDGAWEINSIPETITKDQKNVVVEISLKKTSTSLSKIWTCKIRGKIATIGENQSLDIQTQLDSLKTSIGLTNLNQRDLKKHHNFKKFFNKCIEKRTKENDFESIIDLGVMTESGNKYKFDETQFKNLYTESKIEDLKIPDDCLDRNNDDSFKECTLNKDKLKLINFLNKGANESTVSENSVNLKLQIEKTSDKEIFQEGLKFTFKDIAKDITVQLTEASGANKTITLKNGTNPEFKITKQSDKHYLEKAWSSKSLLDKAVKDCTVANEESNCTLQQSSATVNLWKDANNYVIGATLGNDQTNKKIIFATGETENYNQGFKFTVENDVTLNTTNAKGKKTVNEWELKKDNKNYQVLLKEIDNKQKEWFLVEKT